MNKSLTIMINNSTNINKINNHLSPQLIKHKKKPTTYDVENPGHHLGRAQRGSDVKSVNGILTLLIIGSPTAIHI